MRTRTQGVSASIADRLLTGDLNIPRESSLALLRDIVMSGRFKLDPQRNDFPVTLHDPCNMVRLMGIVEPQREILRKICPQFREMTPHGVNNYCCGGGSGFAIMSGHNFEDWRFLVSGRMKLKQVLEAFADCPSPHIMKYRLRAVQQLQGPVPRSCFRYYGAVGEVWHPVRRPGRTNCERDGRGEGAIHQEGVPRGLSVWKSH